jgi:hypothetical protein
MNPINSSNKINTVSVVSDKPLAEKDTSKRPNPLPNSPGNLALSGEQASARKIDEVKPDKPFPFSSLPPEMQSEIFSFLPLQEALNTYVYLRVTQLPPQFSEKLLTNYHNSLSEFPSEKEIFEFYTKIKIPDCLNDKLDKDQDYETTTNLVLERIEKAKSLSKKYPFDDFFRDVLNNVFTKDELQNASHQFKVFIIDDSKYDLNNSTVKAFLSKLEELREMNPNYCGTRKAFLNLGSLVMLNNQNSFGLEFYGLLMRCWGISTNIYRLPKSRDCTFSTTFRIAARACANMSNLEREAYEKLFQHLWSNNQELILDRAIWGDTLDALEMAHPLPAPDQNALQAIRANEHRLGLSISREILNDTLLFLERASNLLLAQSTSFEEALDTIRNMLPGLVVHQTVKITIKQGEIRGNSDVYLPLLQQIFPNAEIILHGS